MGSCGKEDRGCHFPQMDRFEVMNHRRELASIVAHEATIDHSNPQRLPMASVQRNIRIALRDGITADGLADLAAGPPVASNYELCV